MIFPYAFIAYFFTIYWVISGNNKVVHSFFFCTYYAILERKRGRERQKREESLYFILFSTLIFPDNYSFLNNACQLNLHMFT